MGEKTEREQIIYDNMQLGEKLAEEWTESQRELAMGGESLRQAAQAIGDAIIKVISSSSE